jgi:hypothetical protein
MKQTKGTKEEDVYPSQEDLTTNNVKHKLVEVSDCPICGCTFDSFLGCLVCISLEKGKT